MNSVEVVGEVSINESFLKLLSTYFFRRLVLGAPCPEPGLSPRGNRFEKEQMGHITPPSVLLPPLRNEDFSFQLAQPLLGLFNKDLAFTQLPSP